jgi:hypothetical protein
MELAAIAQKIAFIIYYLLGALRTGFYTLSAHNTFIGEKLDLWFGARTFRIMAPETAERTSF